jgi:hypothetical protein
VLPERLNPAPKEERMKEPLKSEPPGESIAPTELGGKNFTDFWSQYPRRVGKKDALRAWNKALKDGASAEEIVRGAERYRADVTRDPAFTSHPATWLNGGRWLDDPVVSSPVQALGESEYLPMRFSDLPEGITFSEFLKNHATAEEREKAKRLGLKL